MRYTKLIILFVCVCCTVLHCLNKNLPGKLFAETSSVSCQISSVQADRTSSATVPVTRNYYMLCYYDMVMNFNKS